MVCHSPGSGERRESFVLNDGHPTEVGTWSTRPQDPQYTTPLDLRTLGPWGGSRSSGSQNPGRPVSV